MIYSILFTKRSRKEFAKLSRGVQKRIMVYLETKISLNPCQFGKSLVGDKQGLWRYRVGDYRIICNIDHDKLLILVVNVGHRREVYD